MTAFGLMHHVLAPRAISWSAGFSRRFLLRAPNRRLKPALQGAARFAEGALFPRK